MGRKKLVLTLSAVLVGGLSTGCFRGESDSDESARSESPPPSQTAPGAQMPPGTQSAPTAGMRAGTVTETMDAAGYTYVEVDTGGETFWAAAPTFAVEVGDPVTVPAGMAMPGFHSNALNRDFDVVYFVDAVRVGGDASPMDEQSGTMMRSLQLPAGHPPVTAPRSDIQAGDIDVPDGGRTVGEIIAQSSSLDGSTVSFRGKVVKFNANIMGSNWLHIQDGTGSPGNDDLTVTTKDVARLGDVVTVKGVLATDKDFGAGYKYDLIVEDAKVTVD